MPDNLTYVGYREDPAVLAGLDAAAADEARRTGRRVSRSDMIREATAALVARRQRTTTRQGRMRG